MKARASAKGSELTLAFTPAENEGTLRTAKDGRKIDHLARWDCRFHLRDGWQLEKVHPDLVAAVCIALTHGVIKDRLQLSFRVSTALAERVNERFAFDLEPTDPTLPGRQAPRGSKPGLCFSGGVDSTAALLLLPQETVSVFLERTSPPEGAKKGLYRKEAALKACDLLKETGREVYSIKTDMEFTRRPAGFHNDLTMAAPLMLMADDLGLDSVAYGLIMESAYLNRGHVFREYAQTPHYLRYGGVAEAVGLPFNLVTAGLSEVVTSRLVLESPYHHIAQSCVRGVFARPCMNCWKCFRKLLLESVLAESPLGHEELDRLFLIPEVKKELEKIPIKHENVMAYIVKKYRSEHKKIEELRKRLGVDRQDLEWTTRWYSAAAEVITEKYTQACVKHIRDRVTAMTKKDLLAFRAWDVS
jgi:hypothetical protein